MKYLIILIILNIAAPSFSQWKYHSGNTPVVAFALHDTSFYVSGDDPILNRSWIRRLNPDGWADTGLDLTQGPMLTFASLGPNLLAGSYNEGNGGLGGIGALSTNNGSSWKSVIGGPIGTNGTYFYGNFGSYPDSEASVIAVSKDSGKTWKKLYYSAGITYAGWGACVLTNSPKWGVSRSLDSGTTWSGVPAPFWKGNLLRMGTIVFLYDPYHYRSEGPGVLVMSRDSGMNWDTVQVDSAGTPEYVTALGTDGKNLFVGGHNKNTLYANGVFVSTDTGRTWRSANDGLSNLLHPLAFGVWDTMLYVSMADGGEHNFATYYRPIHELIDTTHSAVTVSPPLAQESILVYPNPSTGIVTIEAPSASIQSVTVLNLLGEAVLQVEDVGRAGQPWLPGRPTRVDLSKLPAGTYFLRIETPSRTMVRKVVQEK